MGSGDESRRSRLMASLGERLTSGDELDRVAWPLTRLFELRDLLGGPLDPRQLETARELVCGAAAGANPMELALGAARDHAVKASDALDGADGLDPDVCRTLGRLVDGLVHRER